MSDKVKKAGRGFLVITGAKVWFLVTSAIVQLGLPIAFGSAEMFGMYKIVTEAISLLNMVMITGTLQAVSKLVSERPEQARRIVNQAVMLQCFIGVPLFLAYMLGSPLIAASFNDDTLVPLLQLSSLIIAFYGFYAIFVGYLNGVQEFVKQASLDIGFSTLKMVGILGLVLLGFGVTGAVSGFVAAAGIICLVAGIWVFVLIKRSPETPPAESGFGRLLTYLILVMLYTFALNGLMRADLFILKSVSADVPASLVGAEGVFKVVSDKIAGFYGAVLNIARIPYQGVIAITFIIFPMISEATFKEDHTTTANYIRSTMRYCILIISTVAFLLIFNSDAIIGALYSTDYQAASTALSYLSMSIIFFAIFFVATTIVIGAGHPIVAVVLMGASLAFSAGLNWILVRRVHESVMPDLTFTQPGSVTGGASETLSGAIHAANSESVLAAQYLLRTPEYMESAAMATALAMGIGCILSILWMGWKFKAWPPVATLLRLAVIAAALAAIERLIPLDVALVLELGKLKFLGLVVAKMAGMGVVILILLFALREVTKEDIARFRKVLGR